MDKFFEFDVIVIGLGAAGLFCIGELAKDPSLKVAGVEFNKVPGRKILISGGGRCNFTNLRVGHKDFVGDKSFFPRYALREYSSKDFIAFVQESGIKYFEKKLGQLFCQKSAKDIIDTLMKRCQSPKITLYFNQKETGISFVDNKYVISTNGQKLRSSQLVIASGGLSIPTIGASDFGYRIGKKFGHKITSTQAALVGLKTQIFEGLAGISTIAKVSIGKFNIIEDVLITHRGLSGPAILKASLHWNKGERVRINWLVESFKVEDLRNYKNKNSNKKVATVLEGHLPKRLAHHLIEKCMISTQVSFKEISKKELNKLIEILIQTTFIPTSSEGYRKAEVTRGGICTDEVCDLTMESKKQVGLYFIGEVLDVTGQLGGFNFQWAWSSAYVAAKDILTRQKHF